MTYQTPGYVSLQKPYSWFCAAHAIRGLTTVILKLLGTCPSMSEQFTNFVSNCSSISLHSFMGNVGHGSKRKDFVGEFPIILWTASSET